MRDEILNFVKENGPVLPIEVASKVGVNSFLAAGYLEELVESKQIISSKEKIGSTRLFFVESQKGKVTERLRELTSQIVKTTSTFKSKSIKEDPELIKKRKDFTERLKKIEEEDVKSKPKPDPEPRYESEVAKEEPRIKVIPRQPAIKTARSFIESKIKGLSSGQELESRPTTDRLTNTVLAYMKERSIQTLSSVEEVNSRESEIKVSVPSDVGPVKFLVKIKSKKKINRSDLMQIYVEATERHMPAILFSDGKLTITAKKYLKEVGGFIRVKLF